MNCAAQSLIVTLLQVKNILSMMGVIIVFSIRTISYRYWMILSRISYDLPLKLQMKKYYALKIYGTVWRHYQVGRIAHVRLS